MVTQELLDARLTSTRAVMGEAFTRSLWEMDRRWDRRFRWAVGLLMATITIATAILIAVLA